MIRCSECKHFDKMPIKTKVFYYCMKHTDGSICNGVQMLWQKVPRTHPRWCPIYRGEKNAEKRNVVTE